MKLLEISKQFEINMRKMGLDTYPAFKLRNLIQLSKTYDVGTTVHATTNLYGYSAKYDEFVITTFFPALMVNYHGLGKLGVFSLQYCEQIDRYRITEEYSCHMYDIDGITAWAYSTHIFEGMDVLSQAEEEGLANFYNYTDVYKLELYLHGIDGLTDITAMHEKYYDLA